MATTAPRSLQAEVPELLLQEIKGVT